MADESEKKARVVKLRPGSAKHGFVGHAFSGEDCPETVDEVIRAVLNKENPTADSSRIIDRVKSEMAREYGITINERVVRGNDAVNPYFAAKVSPSGVSYLELDIVVAGVETGGSSWTGSVNYRS